ncbi:MAG: very short patch repair endonuclease [Candidatus Niyogibacteria bacterium]|nr:very short patch repair endonuclease [Candidatus Niyogibacteria bacterium]
MPRFLRDKRSPKSKSVFVSRVMSANRSKNTSPEFQVRHELRRIGLEGFRLHTSLPGRPDIAFLKKKLAIFINGCFWHQCPKCENPMPKHNREFWRKKFLNNQIRDKKKIRELRAMGWSSVVIWECDIKKDANKVIEKLRDKLKVRPR